MQGAVLIAAGAVALVLLWRKRGSSEFEPFAEPPPASQNEFPDSVVDMNPPIDTDTGSGVSAEQMASTEITEIASVYAGMAGGASVGFAVGSVPGAFIGAVIGGAVGAIRRILKKEGRTFPVLECGLPYRPDLYRIDRMAVPDPDDPEATKEARYITIFVPGKDGNPVSASFEVRRLHEAYGGEEAFESARKAFKICWRPRDNHHKTPFGAMLYEACPWLVAYENTHFGKRFDAVYQADGINQSWKALGNETPWTNKEETAKHIKRFFHAMRRAAYWGARHPGYPKWMGETIASWAGTVTGFSRRENAAAGTILMMFRDLGLPLHINTSWWGGDMSMESYAARAKRPARRGQGSPGAWMLTTEKPTLAEVGHSLTGSVQEGPSRD